MSAVIAVLADYRARKQVKENGRKHFDQHPARAFSLGAIENLRPHCPQRSLPLIPCFRNVRPLSDLSPKATLLNAAVIGKY